MDYKEYESIKNLEYRDYCAYLQNKYGLASGAYMTPAGNTRRQISRTQEGLMIHHIYEDQAIRLSDKEFALLAPYEWQLPQNLAYCDFLEHLLLHIMICESVEEFELENPLGVGGIIKYIVPELNDVYSGWVTKQDWKRAQHERILEDIKVYFELLRRFKKSAHKFPFDLDEMLCQSLNEKYPIDWGREKDLLMFRLIRKLK